MIYQNTAILHSVMATLCLFSAGYLAVRGGVRENESVEAYFKWFSGFFLYNIFLITPLLIFEELNTYTAYFYLLALLALGYAAWNAFRISIRFLAGEYSRSLLNLFFIFGTGIGVLLHAANFRVPTGSPDGNWVFWYSGEPAALVYVLFMFVAGWSFALLHLINYTKMESVFLRTRSLLFALGGFTLPFAAYFYFMASTMNYIYFAFFFSIFGLTVFATANAMSVFKKIS